MLSDLEALLRAAIHNAWPAYRRIVSEKLDGKAVNWTELHRALTKASVLANLMGREESAVQAMAAGAALSIQGESVPLPSADYATQYPSKILSLPLVEAANEFRKTIPQLHTVFSDVLKFGESKAWFITGIEDEQIVQTVGKTLANMLHDTETGEAAISLGKFFEESEEALKLARWRLENIFQTTLSSAMEAGKWVQDQDPLIRAITPFYRISTADDSAVRPHHIVFHGGAWPSGDPIWQGARPPFSFQCVLPGAVAQGSVEAALKSFYSGPAVEIINLRGDRLSLTVNHPVLTTQGWIPAHRIKEGNDLVCYDGDVEGAFSGAKCDQYEPTAIEDIFETLRIGEHPLSFFTSRPGGVFDFHNDARFLKGDVHVVVADRELGKRLHASFDQSVQYGAFSWEDSYGTFVNGIGEPDSRFHPARQSGAGFPRSGALALDCGAVGFNGHPLDTLLLGSGPWADSAIHQRFANSRSVESGIFCYRQERLSGDVSALNCVQGRYGNVRRSLERRSMRPLSSFANNESVGFGTASGFNVVKPENSHDDGMAHADFIRKLQCGVPGHVSLNKVKAVRNFDFCGHVFDLQTRTGWMVCNNIVISNCRCSRDSMSTMKAEELGWLSLKGEITGKHRETWAAAIRSGMLLPDGTLTGRRVKIDGRWDTFPHDGFWQGAAA